jgi:O-antigen/teichoic acid export membrane protein
MKPLWVRAGFVIGTAAIAVMDTLAQDWVWAALFGACALWGAYSLLWVYRDPGPKA